MNRRSIASTVTLLDKGCEFEGKLSFEGVVRIDGVFRGEIFSQDHLIIGDGAKVEAHLQVGILEVGGFIKGNIMARERVIIHATGRVEGKIETRELEVNRGSRFDGEIAMSALVGEVAAPDESIIHFRPKAG